MKKQIQFNKSIIDNDIPLFKKLLKSSIVEEMDTETHSIMDAAQHGRIEIAKILLKDKRVKPEIYDSSSVMLAAFHGHFEMVELLMKDKRIDPSGADNYAMEEAELYPSIRELLFKDKRVRKLLKKQNIELYNQLMKKEIIQNKINRF